MVNYTRSVETIVIPPEVVASALVKPDEPTGALHIIPASTDPVLQSDQSVEKGGGWRRVVAGTALAGFLTLGLGQGQEASAATTGATETAAAEESGMRFSDWFTIGSVLVAGASVLIAGQSLRSQRHDKQQDRFIDALKSVAGESDAEKRHAQLNILAIYAEDPQHAPKVFRTAAEYLKARRSAIEDIRSEIENGQAGNSAPNGSINFVERLEKTMKPRRNADREMVKLFIKTLPAARKVMQEAGESSIGREIKNYFVPPEKSKLEALREITGLLPARQEDLADADAMNLDLLRDALVDCDVSGISFKGAGMQANNITSVVFEGCDLQQTQLEGTTMLGCDLSGADFRGAYFSVDPEDPYFMGKTTFIGCVIDPETKFGHLPNSHPEARHHSNNPGQPQAYRGGGELTLKDLKVKPGTLSRKQLIELVHSWQRDGGLVLSADSDEAYIYKPDQPATPTD